MTAVLATFQKTVFRQFELHQSLLKNQIKISRAGVEARLKNICHLFGCGLCIFY